jgi:transposase
MMRFSDRQHRDYAGIDLHARTMHLCVLDGAVVCDVNLPSRPDAFLAAIAAFRADVIVGVECMFAWYWLSDLCRKEQIPFLVGHALYVKAIHGAKAKNDRIDANKIARLLKGGNFPLAYAYPKERRGPRDLLRARLRLVRQRAELSGYVHTARRQANLPPESNDVKYKSKRAGITADVADPVVRRIETDLALLEPLDATIRRLEAEIEP